MTREPEVFCDSASGIYIPQRFAEEVQYEFLSGVREEDMRILREGPTGEWYWQAWGQVLNDAVLTDSNGQVWNLYQDGDLWIIPEGYEWEGVLQ